MKNIKSYKIFEGKEIDLEGAKSAVEESLLELKDDNFNIVIDNDRFSGSSTAHYRDVRCFSLFINLPTKKGFETINNFFNFQDVIDNIWRTINITLDYGFDVYVLSFNTDKIINGVASSNLIWSPLDVSNLEEVLESIGMVNSISVSFYEKGKLKEMIEDNKKSKKLSPKGIEYK